MSRYSEFFLNSKAAVAQLETLEISHPAFSQVYRIVRNAVQGITAMLEDGITQAVFNYLPCRITPIQHSADDIDQSMKIDLGDLGQIFPLEMDRVKAANQFTIKPACIYRTYRSDDLTAPLYGPILLEIANAPFVKEGVSCEARAPRLNNVATGEIYTTDRFPMLNGFV
jgi:hypothetical protein